MPQADKARPARESAADRARLDRAGVEGASDREERFRRLADAIPEVIWITDLDPERVVYAGPSFERIWGLPLSALYENPRLWTDNIHPEDRARVVDAFSRWVSGQGVDYEDVEFRIVRPDGDVRWIHERGVLSFDERGKPVGASGISTDVTERKRAEQSLRRSEAYLAEAQQLSLTGSFGWNVSTGALFWSEQTYRLVGLDRAVQPTLEDVLRRMHPDDVERFRETIQRATDQRAGLDFEHRFLMADGSIKHVQVVARAEQGRDGLEYVGAVTDVTALRRSQEALETAFREVQAVQEEFRLAVDTIPGLVWTGLPNGYIDFLNQRWQEYTGLSQEEAGGWGWQQAIHPEDLPRLLEVWRGLLATGSAGEVEARLRSVTGTYRWFLFRAVPHSDEAGRVLKWYGQTTDIDDRKRAEMVLAGEKRLLEVIAKGSALAPFLDALCRSVEELAPGCHCSVLLLDSDGRRVRHGAAPSLPPGYNAAIDGRPATLEAGPCGLAASLNEQVIVEDIASDSRWDTSGWRDLALAHGLRACWSTPFMSPGGRVLGTFALSFPQPGRPQAHHRALIDRFTHIASIAVERAETEGALRGSEASLAAAQRLTRTGSWRWRPATGEVEWSEETYRIYDVDPSITPTLEMALDRVVAEDKQVFVETAERAVPEGKDLSFELRLRTKDSSLRHIEVVGQAMKDDTGRVVEFIGAVREVTREKQAGEVLDKLRAELAHVARVATLGELTASIAHEVNQPLSGIMTNANICLRMLAATPPNLEEAADTARRTIRDSKRAADVISRLRDLFRKDSTARASLDINEAIREVIALTRHQIHTCHVVVRTELGDDLPAIVGDRVQLQQVLLNLILNAAEAMSGVDDRPRELLVVTAREDEEVRVAVRDSGIGFDLKARERLFDAFFTTKAHGMGMGLSIARSIVESHGGRLWAAPNEEHGATFVLTLPRAGGSQHGVIPKDDRFQSRDPAP